MSKPDIETTSGISTDLFKNEIENLSKLMAEPKSKVGKSSRGHLSVGLLPEGMDYICSADLSGFTVDGPIDYDGPSLLQMFDALYVPFAGSLNHLPLQTPFFNELASALYHAAKHGDTRPLNIFAQRGSREERDMIHVWVKMLCKIVDKPASQQWMIRRGKYRMYTGKYEERAWIAELPPQNAVR